MTDHFSQITFLLACTAFKTRKPQAMTGTHPISMIVGERGCEDIVRDPNGGFDILGEDGQSFWVADGNVVWARKAKVEVVDPVADTERVPEVVPVQPVLLPTEVVVHPGEPVVVDEPVEPPQPKQKRGRPKGKK